MTTGWGDNDGGGEDASDGSLLLTLTTLASALLARRVRGECTATATTVTAAVDTTVLEESQREQEYVRALRSAVRGLWTGALDYYGFVSAMYPTIERGVRWAWMEGAKECGVKSDADLSSEAQHARDTLVRKERQYLNDFARAIEDGSKAKKGHLAPLMQRAELWANRFVDAVNQARLYTCARQRLVWELGRTEKHCEDCLALKGTVKTADEWKASGVRPQSKRLACGGWHCDCRLTPTQQPITSKAIHKPIGTER